MSIRAGDLRHYCTLEHEVKTADGARGQPVKEWRPVSQNVPTRIESLAGRHLEIARQLVATATHQITLRYRPGVLPGMRLTGLVGQWAGRHFAVGHAGDGGGVGEDLVLTCTEQRTGATP